MYIELDFTNEVRKSYG